jgi:hypothetical protein
MYVFSPHLQKVLLLKTSPSQLFAIPWASGWEFLCPLTFVLFGIFWLKLARVGLL